MNISNRYYNYKDCRDTYEWSIHMTETINFFSFWSQTQCWRSYKDEFTLFSFKNGFEYRDKGGFLLISLHSFSESNVKYVVRCFEFYILFMTSKKQNHQFSNLKCCKMSFKANKMKKPGLKCFWINKEEMIHHH